MGSTFFVNHEEVNKAVKNLTMYIDNDILAEAEVGYSKINELLRQMDGATNNKLIEAMENNLEKTRVTSMILSKLLFFIENSSLELEAEDSKMAKEINVGERGVK